MAPTKVKFSHLWFVHWKNTKLSIAPNSILVEETLIRFFFFC
uniref:Uncharacterized protein n=1 Tax=Rhizophora mucronata TaxID=61149 RepID=A0A2P2R582_RHIMU